MEILQDGPSWNRHLSHLKECKPIMLMDYCKKDITPLLTHWSYVFLALSHRCIFHITSHLMKQPKWFYKLVKAPQITRISFCILKMLLHSHSRQLNVLYSLRIYMCIKYMYIHKVAFMFYGAICAVMFIKLSICQHFDYCDICINLL